VLIVDKTTAPNKPLIISKIHAGISTGFPILLQAFFTACWRHLSEGSKSKTILALHE